MGLWVITQLLHSKEMEWPQDGHRGQGPPTNPWLGNTCWEEDSAKGKLNHALLHSFTDKSNSRCKQIVISEAVKVSNFTYFSPAKSAVRYPWLGHTPRSCPLLKESSEGTPLQHHLALPLLTFWNFTYSRHKTLRPGLPAACIFLLLKTMSWSPALKLDVAKQKEISFCPISLDHCFPFRAGLFPVIPVESTFPFCLKILQFRFQISNQVLSTMTCTICGIKQSPKYNSPHAFATRENLQFWVNQ